MADELRPSNPPEFGGELPGGVDRLLALHDEMDEVKGGSAKWSTPIWIALVMVSVMGLLRVVDLGISLGFALQFGAVIAVGGVAVGVPFWLKRRRLQELRREIESIEMAVPRRSTIGLGPSEEEEE